MKLKDFENRDNVTLAKSVNRSKELQQELIQATSFLDIAYTKISFRQRLFHYREKKETQNCAYCENPVPWKSYGGYYTHCGLKECKQKHDKEKRAKEWASTTPEAREKRREKWKASRIESNMKDHGVKWHSQTEDYWEKVEKTSLEKFGVNHYSQTEECKERKRETCTEKYGIDNPFKDREKMEAGMMKKYGVKNPLHSISIQDKINNTNLEKYGVKWYTQSLEFQEKTKQFYSDNFNVFHNSQLSEVLEKRKRKGFSWKPFTFPSGRTVKVQGYEDKVLSKLLETHKENDIFVSSREIEQQIGKIWYIGADNKKHLYFPDIYIKSENKIVEVKSKWTFEIHRDVNLLKQNRCIEMGMNFEFVLM